eukprot:1910420-Alexandrium_andersonii.AAC.1
MESLFCAAALAYLTDSFCRFLARRAPAGVLLCRQWGRIKDTRRIVPLLSLASVLCRALSACLPATAPAVGH